MHTSTTGNGSLAPLGRASYAMMVAPSLLLVNEIHWVDTAGSSGATDNGLVELWATVVAASGRTADWASATEGTPRLESSVAVEAMPPVMYRTRRIMSRRDMWP